MKGYISVLKISLLIFFKYKKNFVLISIFHLFGTVVHKYMALTLITGLEVADA